MWIWWLSCTWGLPRPVEPGSPEPSCGVPVDAARIVAAVDHLASSPRASPSRRAEVREWLRSELVGFAVEELPFSIAGLDGTNVVARSPGARILVGAHYDTVPGSPGADDNASGVAVVLEVARALGPKAPVTWVWFDAEEPHGVPVGVDGRNYAYGSQAFVDREAGWDAVFVVESVGYRCDGCQQVPRGVPASYADGGAVYWVANPSDRWADLAATFDTTGARSRLFTVAGAGRVVPQSRFSDHAPFWDAGLDAVLITDTALLRNPDYHRPTDTHVDPVFLGEVARGLAAAVASAAGICGSEVGYGGSAVGSGPPGPVPE